MKMAERKRLKFEGSEKGLETSSSEEDIGDLSSIIAKGIIDNMNDREMQEIYKLEEMMKDNFLIDKVVQTVSNIVGNAYGQSVAVETLNLIDENEEKASLNLAKELIGLAHKARHQALLDILRRKNLPFKDLSLDSTIVEKDRDTTNSKGDFKSQISPTRNKRLSISRIPIKIPQNIRPKLDNNERERDLDTFGNRNSSITLKHIVNPQTSHTKVQTKSLKNQSSQESIEDTNNSCNRRNNASPLNSFNKKKEMAELEMKLPKRRLRVTKLHRDNEISKKCRMTEEELEPFIRNESLLQKEHRIPSTEFNAEEHQSETIQRSASMTVPEENQSTLHSLDNQIATDMQTEIRKRRKKCDNKVFSNEVNISLRKNFKKPMLPLKPVLQFLQSKKKISKNIFKAIEDIDEIHAFKTLKNVVCPRCKKVSGEYSNYSIRCSGVTSRNINLSREISLCQILMDQMSKEEKDWHFKKAFNSLKLKLNTQDGRCYSLKSSQTSLLSSGLFSSSKGASKVNLTAVNLHPLEEVEINGKKKNDIKDSHVNAISFENIKIQLKTPHLETSKQAKRLTSNGLRTAIQPEEEEDRCGDDSRSKESLEVNTSFSDGSMKTFASKISLGEYTTNLQRESDSYFFQSYTNLPIKNGFESSLSSLDGSIGEDEASSFCSLKNQSSFDWTKCPNTSSIIQAFDISEGVSPLNESEVGFFDWSSSSLDPRMPITQQDEKDDDETPQRSSRNKLFWRNGNKVFVFLLIGMSSLAMIEGFRISMGYIRDYVFDFFHGESL